MVKRHTNSFLFSLFVTMNRPVLVTVEKLISRDHLKNKLHVTNQSFSNRHKSEKETDRHLKKSLKLCSLCEMTDGGVLLGWEAWTHGALTSCSEAPTEPIQGETHQNLLHETFSKCVLNRGWRAARFDIILRTVASLVYIC